MGAERRFLEAGDAQKLAPVRPRIAKGKTKGLGHEADPDVLETVDGEWFPSDVATRDAETARVENEEDMVAVEDDEVDDVTETVEVKARKAPKEPTEMERLRHEATHVPYRSWCQHCVRGRGRCKPHYRKVESEDCNAVPKVSMDYFFLGGDDADASDCPMFVMMDEERGNRYARMLEHKGTDKGENEWLILDAAEEIRSWGHVEGGEFILKSDREPAM